MLLLRMVYTKGDAVPAHRGATWQIAIEFATIHECFLGITCPNYFGDRCFKLYRHNVHRKLLDLEVCSTILLVYHSKRDDTSTSFGLLWQLFCSFLDMHRPIEGMHLIRPECEFSCSMSCISSNSTWNQRIV